jgi:hypothetical protein
MSKDKTIEKIRKYSNEDYNFLIRCLFNYFSSNELEEFADFVEDENQ